MPGPGLPPLQRFFTRSGPEMLLASLVVVSLLAASRAAADEEEIPFVIASQGNAGNKVSHLLPDSRGRSDIEIEQEEQRPQQQQPPPFLGYFYPRPGKAFELPPFSTLQANGSPQ